MIHVFGLNTAERNIHDFAMLLHSACDTHFCMFQEECNLQNTVCMMHVCICRVDSFEITADNEYDALVRMWILVTSHARTPQASL